MHFKLECLCDISFKYSYKSEKIFFRTLVAEFELENVILWL
jgi:hypothetical protein